jgi:hypothetical protein
VALRPKPAQGHRCSALPAAEADDRGPPVIPFLATASTRTPPPAPSLPGARVPRVGHMPRPGPRDYLRPPHPVEPPTLALSAAVASSASRRNPRCPSPPLLSADAASSSRSSPRGAQGGEGPAGIACLRHRNLAGLRHPRRAAPPRQAPASPRLHRDHHPRSPRRFACFA